jgi:hypothetical protein
MDERSLAGEDVRRFKVGDLVKFKSIDDVMGLMNESIGLITGKDHPKTVEVRWLTGLLIGKTTNTFPFQLERVEPIEEKRQ